MPTAMSLADDLAANNLPAQFTKWGLTLTAVGRGKYPYDCISKDQQPNAMIYYGEHCWSSEFSYEFLTRDNLTQTQP